MVRGKTKEEHEMKKIGKKGIAAIIGAVIALVAVAVIALAAILILRIDGEQAQQIAIQQAGGGEIISQEVSREGLWNEYSYIVVNGDRWVKIDITVFGNIEEIETGVGNTYRD